MDGRQWYIVLLGSIAWVTDNTGCTGTVRIQQENNTDDGDNNK